jgi:hypothetical protein
MKVDWRPGLAQHSDYNSESIIEKLSINNNEDVPNGAAASFTSSFKPSIHNLIFC